MSVVLVHEAIPTLLDGERIDRVVAMLTDLSRAVANELIDRGSVTIDGRVVTSRSQKVSEGAVVEVTGTVDVVDSRPRPDPAVAVSVVHADDDLVVVDKPPGLIVHPGAGNPAGTLVNGLLARYPEMADVGDPARPGVVHRLDKGTSGLLVVARSAAGYEGLVAQLGARTVGRAYDVLVWGVPASTTGLVDAPIGRSKRDPTRMSVASDGREARTNYQVVDRFAEPEPMAQLVCRLETGRTHQIRVHLEAIGHSVVGDTRYGGSRTHVAGLERPFLHARHLAFIHPVTGDPLAFDSPLPPDLVTVLSGLTPARG